MSDLSDALAKRGTLIGTMITVASGAIAEALSHSGLDWLFFDLEHSVMRLDEVQAMIQAMNRDCLAMIRVEEPSPLCVKRALDTGLRGGDRTAGQQPGVTKAVVAAGKYPPRGERGVGLSRAVSYGASLAQGVVAENARTSILVQIEHKDALKDLDAIAALDGVDALFIGPYDLSGSFGIPGEIDDPRVQDAIERVIAAGRRAGKPVAIFLGTAEAATKAIARGITIACVGADVPRLVGATKEIAEAMRK